MFESSKRKKIKRWTKEDQKSKSKKIKIKSKEDKVKAKSKAHQKSKTKIKESQRRSSGNEENNPVEDSFSSPLGSQLDDYTYT